MFSHKCKFISEFHDFSLSFLARTRVAFGTTLNRELLPLKPPHTRAGNELGLRGMPNLGPGVYDNDEVQYLIVCYHNADTILWRT